MKPEKQKEYIGQKFGRLTILSFNEPKVYEYAWKTKIYSVNCLCDCGKEHTVDFQSIKLGRSKSCGCYNIEVASNKFTHGETKNNIKSPEYQTWSRMKKRCYNSNDKDYHHYGGRGILMNENWKSSFSSFLEDMGRMPDNGYSIERIDCNKGYTKENCKWIPVKDQPKNTRLTKQITYQDKTQCLADWCRELNLKYSVMRHRVCDLNILFEVAMTLPEGIKLKNKLSKIAAHMTPMDYKTITSGEYFLS